MPSHNRNKGWKMVHVKEALHARLNSIRDVDNFESFSVLIARLLDHWIMCPLRRTFERVPSVSTGYRPVQVSESVPVPVVARSYGIPRFEKGVNQ